MNVLQVIPRLMRFSRSSASSIELCVAEWVSASRYRATTRIVAEAGDDPILDIPVLRLLPTPYAKSWALAWQLRRMIKVSRCDVVLKHQHIATASRIALLSPSTPVILHTHNYIDSPATGPGSCLKNHLRRRQFRRLSGITFISQSTRDHFQRHWPDIHIKSVVLHNGFDFSTWNPHRPRENCLLVVGRANPEKGILESAKAVADVLQRQPDWRAVFVLADLGSQTDYRQRIFTALKAVEQRVQVLVNVTHDRVRDLTERAAISIVASKWQEPFGRTALEAHAGGCALISSGSGGLREVSGPHAVYLPEVTAEHIVSAVESLIADPARRQRLAHDAGIRVRQRFSLKAQGSDGFPGISQTLDEFIDSVVATHAARGRASHRTMRAARPFAPSTGPSVALDRD